MTGIRDKTINGIILYLINFTFKSKIIVHTIENRKRTGSKKIKKIKIGESMNLERIQIK